MQQFEFPLPDWGDRQAKIGPSPLINGPPAISPIKVIISDGKISKGGGAIFLTVIMAGKQPFSPPTQPEGFSGGSEYAEALTYMLIKALHT